MSTFSFKQARTDIKATPRKGMPIYVLSWISKHKALRKGRFKDIAKERNVHVVLSWLSKQNALRKSRFKDFGKEWNVHLNMSISRDVDNVVLKEQESHTCHKWLASPARI